MSTAVKKTSSNQIDMCEGALFPKFLRFAIPVMLANMLQTLFNAADMAIIGVFCGDVSLAAISSTGSLCAFLTGLLMGLSVGSNVLAARFFGAKDDSHLSKTVHTSLVISLIAGILVTVIGLIFAPMLLEAMNVPDNVLPLSKTYLFIYFLGITPTIIFNYAAAVLRAVGDTKRPLYYLMFAGVLNVLLNILFVTVIKLDVAGVAIATVISQTLAMILIIRCLLRETGAMRFEWKKLALDKSIALQIIRIGLPAGLQTSLFSVSNIAIQSSINVFGDAAISGSGAMATIESIAYVAMNAWTTVVVSSTSQNFGVRNHKRIINSQLLGQACVIAVGVFFAIIYSIFGKTLLGMFVDSPEALEAGLLRMNYIGKMYFTCGIMDVLTSGLRGLGRSFLPMLVSLFGSVLLRIVWVNTVFLIPEYHTLSTVFFIYPVSWILTSSVLLIMFIFSYRKTVRQFTCEYSML
ncbi:MAG: MATE family efflux transporter [Clostridia bacterium]|nr:MATE family efflux transporter [Clostridia bacterium]